MVKNFSFNRRNHGHWDVYDSDTRVFRIRGGGHKPWEEEEVQVIGENSMRETTTHGWLEFKTITAATAWITDQMMHERKVWPKEGESNE